MDGSVKGEDDATTRDRERVASVGGVWQRYGAGDVRGGGGARALASSPSLPFFLLAGFPPHSMTTLPSDAESRLANFAQELAAELALERERHNATYQKLRHTKTAVAELRSQLKTRQDLWRERKAAWLKARQKHEKLKGKYNQLLEAVRIKAASVKAQNPQGTASSSAAPARTNSDELEVERSRLVLCDKGDTPPPRAGQRVQQSQRPQARQPEQQARPPPQQRGPPTHEQQQRPRQTPQHQSSRQSPEPPAARDHQVASIAEALTKDQSTKRRELVTVVTREQRPQQQPAPPHLSATSRPQQAQPSAPAVAGSRHLSKSSRSNLPAHAWCVARHPRVPKSSHAPCVRLLFSYSFLSTPFSVPET